MMNKHSISLLLAFALFCAMGYSQSVTFLDVASERGLNYKGKTFGASWGDFTGDGLPELYVSGHANSGDLYYDNDEPTLYLNNAGVFEPFVIVTHDQLNSINGKDWHGMIFFDFDRDQDFDLIGMQGGGSPNKLYINNGEVEFTDQADSYGLSFLDDAGRTPGLVDINNDGFTDLILNNLGTSGDPEVPRLMINDSGNSFEEASIDFGFDWNTSVFSTTADLTGSGSLDLICLKSRPVIYQTDQGVLVNPQAVGSSSGFDFLIEDLNGDLLPDIFSVRADKTNSVVELISSELIRTYVKLSSSDDPIQFEFTTSADSVTVSIQPRKANQPYTFVLGDNVLPDILGQATEITVDENQVILSEEIDIPGSVPQSRVYLDYNSETEVWRVRLKGSTSSSSPLGVDIVAQDLVLFNGFEPLENLGAELLLNQGNYQFEKQVLSVFDDVDNFQSVVAADFDNDMDMDLYVSKTNYAKNKSNVLWENVDNLSWIRHEDAWGALGNGPGIGESVTSVDYNNDGFIDLFVCNGYSVFWLDSARTNLYENQGNGNNWIKVELEGVRSDPIGLHSKVILHAGGVSQIRYQNGGTHRFSQNDHRLHFGLAQNEEIDSLEIFWPSGIHQLIYDLDINQIVTISEEVPCENPYPSVTNLESEISSDGVTLRWSPIPGSQGCRIKGGPSQSIDTQVFQVLGLNISEYFVPSNLLQSGVEYRWKVRCGCSFEIGSPFSDYSFFTWNAPTSFVNEQSIKSGVYPNPVSGDHIRLKWQYERGEYLAVFYDVGGRAMKEEVISVEAFQELILDVKSLDTGVYLLEISNATTRYSERIVIL